MTQEMKLSPAQRLIVYNQLEILKKLDSDNEDEYELKQNIVYRGHSYFYGELGDFVTAESEDETKEVMETLQMFRVIGNAIRRLKEEGTELNFDEESLRFKGYDGNEETNFYSIANFVLSKDPAKGLGRFKEVHEYLDYFNTHSPVRHEYQRLFRAYRSLGTSVSSSELSIDQLRVLAEVAIGRAEEVV